MTAPIEPTQLPQEITPIQQSNDMNTAQMDGLEDNRPTERYFLMRCKTLAEIEQASRTNLWPTHPTYHTKLQEAYKEAPQVILIFTLREARTFCALARMASEIAWLPERTVFDRSIYRQRMQVEWLAKGSKVGYDQIIDALHLAALQDHPRPSLHTVIRRHGDELESATGRVIHELVLKDLPNRLGSSTKARETPAIQLEGASSIDSIKSTEDIIEGTTSNDGVQVGLNTVAATEILISGILEREMSSMDISGLAPPDSAKDDDSSDMDLDSVVPSEDMDNERQPLASSADGGSAVAEPAQDEPRSPLRAPSPVRAGSPIMDTTDLEREEADRTDTMASRVNQLPPPPPPPPPQPPVQPLQLQQQQQQQQVQQQKRLSVIVFFLLERAAPLLFVSTQTLRVASSSTCKVYFTTTASSTESNSSASTRKKSNTSTTTVKERYTSSPACKRPEILTFFRAQGSW
ncbi:MAG: YT521-B-like domain-containing protein [Benniella sp.]|nr:MAG: YT521-B-like domain-containing protein [Benniella sp.]